MNNCGGPLLPAGRTYSLKILQETKSRRNTTMSITYSYNRMIREFVLSRSRLVAVAVAVVGGCGRTGRQMLLLLF